MSQWWHDLWNDPVNENPWAFGAYIACTGIILLALYVLVIVQEKWRRRKQETMNDETKTDEKWPLDDSDRAAAERVIAASRSAEASRPEGVDELRPVAEVGDEQIKAPPADDGESQRLETLMHTDPRLINDPLGAPLDPTSPAPIPTKPGMVLPSGAFDHRGVGDAERMTDDDGRALRDISAGERGRFTIAAPQPGRNILAGKPVLAAAPPAAPLVAAERQPCRHCEGMGYVPSISDNLRQSITLVGDSGDEIIQAFYAELLALAPGLASLFPRDLLDPRSPSPGDMDGESPRSGRGQRDKLLHALKALSEMYDPADDEKMARLDTALKAFGRSHAAFVRPSGEIKGATWEEYAAVKEVLFRTLTAAAGSAWKPEYTASWSQAYDYAAGVMIAEQHRSAFSAPRFPRA